MQPTIRAPLKVLTPRPRSRLRWLKFVAIVGAIALSMGLFDRVLWPNRYYAPWLFGEAVYQVQTAEKVVALTFDDGPDPRYTQDIGHILVEAGAKGTFFCHGATRRAASRGRADLDGPGARTRQPHLEPPQPQAEIATDDS